MNNISAVTPTTVKKATFTNNVALSAFVSDPRSQIVFNTGTSQLLAPESAWMSKISTSNFSLSKKDFAFNEILPANPMVINPTNTKLFL